MHLRSLTQTAALAGLVCLLAGAVPSAAHAVPVDFTVTGDVNNVSGAAQALDFGVFGFCLPCFSTEEFGKCLSIPVAPGCHPFSVSFCECLPASPIAVGISHHVFSSCCPVEQLLEPDASRVSLNSPLARVAVARPLRIPLERFGGLSQGNAQTVVRRGWRRSRTGRLSLAVLPWFLVAGCLAAAERRMRHSQNVA